MKINKELREDSRKVWFAKDQYDEDRIYVFENEPTCSNGIWDDPHKAFVTQMEAKYIPDLTFENSPRKATLIFE
jgi:hypothetical protein